MNKSINSQIITSIVKLHKGKLQAINQHDIADEYIRQTDSHITARTVRNVIEELRFKKVPILSTPHEPGGYFWPATRGEYFEWKAREKAKAEKQLAKIKPVGIGVYQYFHPGIIQQALSIFKRNVKRAW